MSDSEKPVEEVSQYWKTHEWAFGPADIVEDELEDLLEELKYDLQKEQWDKLHDPEYVKSHFTAKDTESCILECSELEDIKKKIISHFG